MIGLAVVLATPDVRAKLQAGYDRLERACQRHDCDNARKVLAKDCVMVSIDGEETSAAEFLAGLKLRSGAKPEWLDISAAIRKLKIGRDRAEVECEESLRLDVRSVHHHLNRDLWRLEGDTWRLSRSVRIREWSVRLPRKE